MRWRFFSSAVLSFLFTISLSAQAPLTGIYVIGSGGDYTNFSYAVAALDSFGVSGPVVFNVSTGTYTEQISIPEITGTSTNNTITFQSASGNNTDVILQFPSGNSFSSNYVVQLNGSDYIIFQHLTISRTGSSTYARVIDVMGNATNNIFHANRLLGKSGATNDNGANVYSGDANAGNMNNTFSNNLIQDGHAGIWWESSSGSTKLGLTVSGNTISGYRYGLLLKYANNITITGNSITSAAFFNSAQTKGIDCFRCEADMTIAKNNMVFTAATSNYGIDLQASVGSASTIGNISNNMIVVGGTGTSHGINSGSLTSYKNYFFNSVRTSGTNATSSSAYYQNGSNNINLKNNVFVAIAGNAVEILAPTSGLLSSDHNDLYSNGVAVANWGGSNAADLAAWQNLTPAGFDVNSVSADPQFVSSTDLHASGAAIEDAAMPVTGITEDIDGEMRDATNPDMGADEFSDIPDCSGFLVTAVDATDITCNGAADGEITIMVAGGATPYEYSIDSGTTFQSGTDFLNLAPGSYDILVKDSAGCIANYSNNPIIITETAPLILSFIVTDEMAPGTSDGDIDLTVAGGSGNKTFAWSNSATTEDLSNLSAGIYCVTVTDANGCSVSGCDTVVTILSGCLGFAISSVINTDISCDSTNNGTITIDVLAGISPILYSIDSGTTFHTNNGLFKDLTPGTYDIIIRDNIGCEVIYNKNPVLIEAPEPVIPVISESMGTLTASGGVRYQWYFSGSTIDGATMPTYTALQSGEYYALVTNADSCSAFTDTLNIVVSGIPGIGPLQEFIVYPNPAQDQLNISWSKMGNEKVKIEILDLFGRVAIKAPFLHSSENYSTINITHLPGSIYWIRLQAGENIYYRKFLK